MATYTAIAFDSLIEPGSSKSMITANTILEKKNVAANAEADVSSPKLGKRHNTPTPLTIDRKYHWSQISPTLYATPEPTPLPTSPTSFSPSPYVINHKRRGPSLLRSSSQHDVAGPKQAVIDEGVVDANVVVLTPIPTEEKDMNAILDCGNLGDGSTISSVNGCLSRKDGIVGGMTLNLESVNELQDSIHPDKNNNEEEHRFGLQQYLNLATPGSEYFDAWDDLSSESGLQLSLHHAEAELREIRLSLSRETEKRNEAEERLNKMQCEWQKLREQLSLVGINLQADPSALEEEEGETVAEDVCCQLNVGQFVSDSIDRATAKAEIEMERRIETKNVEIARLWDKLRYYETMNSEMSQRNQEAMENARRVREGGNRWQKRLLFWGSISAGTAVVVGTGVLVWSYLDIGGGSSTQTDHSVATDHQTQHR
ncbi:uncharacterized protein LOC124922287 [Impatiens glandulifera]|uniref:uncharacterized protein LOC124922287 n=1 Tax=Impatiens glandulifera TaxID=253017 RepID=UPI001FB0A9F3|nr:uncharacterized protein LOC124922287 [Impatiens glandulifera]